MDEPTLAEEVRRLADEVRRLADAQQTYVTKEILELRLTAAARDLQAVKEDQMEDRARLDAMSRWVWTAVLGPAIVGIILYVVGRVT